MNKVLRNCDYPDWALIKDAAPPQTHDHTDREKGKTICYVTLLYIRGLSKELHRIFKDHSGSSSLKSENTLQQLLVSHKDPTKKEETGGAVYRINFEGVQYRIECEGGQDDWECHSVYVGETCENA